MNRYIMAAVVSVAAVVGFTACDDDRGARQDLPNSQQNLDAGEDADVYLFPDAFPNVVHRCDGTTGLWATTDRNVWIVYSDPLCGGTANVVVLDNIPGTSSTSGGGDG